MRLGVLDVGSNTVHLQVVDAHPGARPSPATNQKVELRLHEYLNKEGEITAEGVALLEESIADAITHAKEFQLKKYWLLRHLHYAMLKMEKVFSIK